MKGVILAGGRGKRLRPLTCNLPKPMVPLLHKPVMEYSIELLKKHGITEIAITTHYLSKSIQNYFGDGSEYGVTLHYFDEDKPLGTAGCLKSAQNFLDETFLVISGDALTDLNLTEGIKFHKEKESLLTIFLKKVENPLEYGIVMTDCTGRVQRFIEKPKWSEVYTHTVNTGIYVVNPAIFSYWKSGTFQDFSYDLFPKLLHHNERLYGFEGEGYWSDVGKIDRYIQTQFDMLDNKVDIKIQGEEKYPRVWVGTNVSIEEGALLVGPLFIGANTVIRTGAKIDPYSIIGQDNLIEANASIERSICWNDVYIGSSSKLQGVTIANDTQISSEAVLCEHCIIGDHSKIGYKSWIKPGVKVWSNKVIFEEAVISTSLVRSNNRGNRNIRIKIMPNKWINSSSRLKRNKRNL
ncbi:NDP-sugar synthase [Cytobacillus sp. S13-E01]|uniref:NDP-sugar synthase n=1 Tax=Cytobacillus sp. S13-E01 TaxID=3031326 RepID=UPI0023D7F262|nr:NDP-sugar synthase [Cytobacillus sp. S13-E01]MDF0727168.1 NDP-sugar synthase [Cytobacillus sp. S13-E01]